MSVKRIAVAALLFAMSASAFAAETGMLALTSTPAAGGGQTYTLSLQTLILISSLTFLPAILLMMTSFTRIIIVLSLLRSRPRHPDVAAESGAGGPGAVSHLFRHVAGLRQDLRRRLPAASARTRSRFTEASRRGSVRSRPSCCSQTREADLALFVRIVEQPSHCKAPRMCRCTS